MPSQTPQKDVGLVASAESTRATPPAHTLPPPAGESFDCTAVRPVPFNALVCLLGLLASVAGRRVDELSARFRKLYRAK